MSELIKCDICGEDINLEDESYRIGENHEGEEINFCESCDNSELEDAAHCIPYGVEWIKGAFQRSLKPDYQIKG